MSTHCNPLAAWRTSKRRAQPQPVVSLLLATHTHHRLNFKKGTLPMKTPLPTPTISLTAVAVILLADAIVLVWIVSKVVASVRGAL